MYALIGPTESMAVPVAVTILEGWQQSFRSAPLTKVLTGDGTEYTVPTRWIFDHFPQKVIVTDDYGMCTVWK